MALTIHPPFEGADGKWVRRNKFTGKKSFGRFCCTSCNKVWVSAHAQAAYKQGCKDCNRYLKATHMWVNHSKPRSPRDNSDDPNAWHKSDLCEACKRGVCKISRDK